MTERWMTWWRRDDRGSILPMVPVLVLVLLLLGGLVVDGGRDLNARSQAQSYAEEAARAGATAVDLTSAQLQLLPAQAQQRVETFCQNVEADSRSHVTGCHFDPPISTVDVTCNGTTVSEHIVVQATVTLEVPTTLLGMININTLHATGVARARPYEGILAPDSC